MRIAVLGAGIQGVCLSLELAGRGVKVDLYEKNDTCVSEASAQNEGKIHLGYVYGNDQSLRTARLMARGAVTFSTLMRRWIEDDIDLVPISSPFLYAVHRNSLISPKGIEHHLMATNAILREERSRLDGSYFGIDCCEPPVRLKDSDNPFACQTVKAAFTTPEVAIDPEVLARLLRDRVKSEPLIQLVMPAKVLSVSICGSTPSVLFEIFGEQFSELYDQVVNTLWDGRLAIDASMGIMPERPWTYRVKRYVRGRSKGLAGAVPSVTVVLGPFGDIVKYPDNHYYLSWYPAGIQGRSHDLTPPEKGRLDDPEAAKLGRAILSGLGTFVPALTNLDLEDLDSWEVKGGVIFAWGKTDIDDSASKLHDRYQVGPRSYGRYHSVDTGKLTLAPLFAKTLADQICGDK